MRFNLKYNIQKMADIGRIVMGGQKGSDLDTAIGGIDKLDEFFCFSQCFLSACAR